MSRNVIGLVLGVMLVAPAWADSLTVGALGDSDDGRSASLKVRYSPTQVLSLGASVGHSEAKVQQEKFSGTTLGASVGLDYDAFFADASVDRWKDSGNLRSTVVNGELGWLNLDGLALSALITHRDMRVTYTTTVLTGTRERNIDFTGTGFGGSATFFGKVWTSGVRFLGYDYGRSVNRVRAALADSNTDRFPRVQDLVGSVATRAASAPDRELSFTLGRQFARASRTSLTADLLWQRDALTGDETRGGGLTLSLTPRSHLGVDISAGASKTDGAGTVAWGGIWLTLSRAR